jgi:catechol 2,3-dioxygenase-like lactoylglutathione lyase family enzyme
MPLDHVSLQAADLSATATFYDRALAPLGITRIVDFGNMIGYGEERPYFWIGRQSTSAPQKEVHIAFRGADRSVVQRFFDEAVAAGAEVLHEPRVFAEYHPNYYGAFVRDPDGNNIEAVCHKPPA